jgi:hypothetical protein
MRVIRQGASKTRSFYPSDYSEGEQLRFPPSDGRLDSIEAPCLPFSGLRPATEGTYTLGSPNRFVASHKSVKAARFQASLIQKGDSPSPEKGQSPFCIPCPLSLQTVFLAPCLITL